MPVQNSPETCMIRQLESQFCYGVCAECLGGRGCEQHQETMDMSTGQWQQHLCVPKELTFHIKQTNPGQNKEPETQRKGRAGWWLLPLPTHVREAVKESTQYNLSHF